MKNIAVIMCYCGRNERWLYQAICSLKSRHSVTVYLHLDGCSAPVSFVLGKNIVVIKSDSRVGYANGINKCMLEIMRNNVQFDYIARMDDDDVSTDDRLDRQVYFLEQRSDIDFCGTLLTVINKNGDIIDNNMNAQANNGINWADRFLAGGCYIANGTVMFRSKILYNGHLWYNPLYLVIEDYELWFRLFRQGYKYDVVPERLYLYRFHQEQETQNHSTHSKRMGMVYEIHKFYVENWNKFLIK